jgi:hypothetical protein
MVFHCITCAFVTDRKSNYDKHNKSQKHILKIMATKLAEVRPPEAEVSQPIANVPSPHKCKFCEQCYRHKSSLSKHIKHSCTKNNNDITEVVRTMNNRLEQQENKLENQKKMLEAQARQIEELKRGKVK